jgi:hypothetical protein
MRFLETAKSVAQTVGRTIQPGRARELVAEKERLRRQRLLLEEDERANRARLRAKRQPAGAKRQPAALAEEVVRARRFVGIAFRGPADNRRAWIPWAGLDVWEIVEDLEEMGCDLLAKEGDIPKKALDLALAYYQAYPEGVDWAIKENRRSPEEWQRLFPHVNVASGRS